MEGRPKGYRPAEDETGRIVRRESLKRYIVDPIGRFTVNYDDLTIGCVSIAFSLRPASVRAVIAMS
jgi:hypothetical protein